MSSKSRLRWDSVTNEELQNMESANDQPSTSHQRFPKKTTSGSWMNLRIVLIVILVICIGSVFFSVDLDTLKKLETTFKKNNTGMMLFIVAAVVAFACLIPGPFIAGASGMLYGKITSVLVVWFAAFAAQSLTYVLGKYLFREMLVSFISRYYKAFSAVDTVIGQQGWKLVFLIRLAPIFPDSILNYVFATTSIPYLPYIAASCTAIFPWIILFTYMGSLATDIASATSLESNMNTKWVTYFTLFSIVLCLVIAYVIARTAKRALEGMMDNKDGNQANSVDS
eukprot:g952.t1